MQEPSIESTHKLYTLNLNTIGIGLSFAPIQIVHPASRHFIEIQVTGRLSMGSATEYFNITQDDARISSFYGGKPTVGVQYYHSDYRRWVLFTPYGTLGYSYRITQHLGAGVYATAGWSTIPDMMLYGGVSFNVYL